MGEQQESGSRGRTKTVRGKRFERRICLDDEKIFERIRMNICLNLRAGKVGEEESGVY